MDKDKAEDLMKEISTSLGYPCELISGDCDENKWGADESRNLLKDIRDLKEESENKDPEPLEWITPGRSVYKYYIKLLNKENKMRELKKVKETRDANYYEIDLAGIDPEYVKAIKYVKKGCSFEDDRFIYIENTKHDLNSGDRIIAFHLMNDMEKYKGTQIEYENGLMEIYIPKNIETGDIKINGNNFYPKNDG